MTCEKSNTEVRNIELKLMMDIKLANERNIPRLRQPMRPGLKSAISGQHSFALQAEWRQSVFLGVEHHCGEGEEIRSIIREW